MKYVRRNDEKLDNDFSNADAFGNIKVGHDALFYRKALKWNCIMMSEVQRIYRRVEEVKGRTGCCSNDFSIHKLVVVLKDDSEVMIKIGEEMYRHEPEMLIERIRELFPMIKIGVNA